MLKSSFMPLPYQRIRQLLQNGGCVYGMSGRCDKGRLTVLILGQPSVDLLQHPRMAQVHAVEAHKLAVGLVSHQCQFEPLGPTILAGTWVTSRRRENSLDQFSQQLRLCPRIWQLTSYCTLKCAIRYLSTVFYAFDWLKVTWWAINFLYNLVYYYCLSL